MDAYQVLELKDEYLNRLVGTSYEDEKYSIAVESKFTNYLTWQMYPIMLE